MQGLFAFLSADTLVDESVVTRLSRAQAGLNIVQRGSFVEGVIGNLNFWNYTENPEAYLTELEAVPKNRGVQQRQQIAMLRESFDLRGEG